MARNNHKLSSKEDSYFHLLRYPINIYKIYSILSKSYKVGLKIAK